MRIALIALGVVALGVAQVVWLRVGSVRDDAVSAPPMRPYHQTVSTVEVRGASAFAPFAATEPGH